MRIRVVEQMPVAVVVGGRTDGRGRRRRDAAARAVAALAAAAITLPVPPGGQRLTGYALTEVRLLAAAPYQLLSKVGGVSDGSTHGLVAQLRDGPSIYFGDSAQLAAKWSAAAAVLANSGSAGAGVHRRHRSEPAGGGRWIGRQRGCERCHDRPLSSTSN